MIKIRCLRQPGAHAAHWFDAEFLDEAGNVIDMRATKIELVPGTIDEPIVTARITVECELDLDAVVLAQVLDSGGQGGAVKP